MIILQKKDRKIEGDSPIKQVSFLFFFNRSPTNIHYLSSPTQIKEDSEY